MLTGTVDADLLGHDVLTLYGVFQLLFNLTLRRSKCLQYRVLVFNGTKQNSENGVFSFQFWSHSLSLRLMSDVDN